MENNNLVNFEENQNPSLKLEELQDDLEVLQRYIEEFSAFLPYAVCMVNPINIVLDINKAFEELTGYGEESIVSEVADILFKEKDDFWKVSERATKKKERVLKELTLITKDGKEIPVSLNISSRKDKNNEFTGFFLAITDIAETKKFQETLEEKITERTKELEDSWKAILNLSEDAELGREKAEEEKNKTLMMINSFVDGLLFFNKEGLISLVNPQAEKFLSVAPKDIIGKSPQELAEIPSLVNIINILGPQIKNIFREEISLKENLTLEISTVPILKDKERMGVLVILHDITREKMIEKMKSEFVSIAAHQLRTPLSAIKWTIRMLLDGDLGEISEEQRALVEKTYLSNERMVRLINDLLNVTRIEEGRYIYKPVLVSLDKTIEEVMESCKSEMQNKKISLEYVKSKGASFDVKADPEKISLAIENIINNAIKYTNSGKKITISLKHNKRELEISVKDQGVGIPQDQQHRIFTKFFRAINVIKMETDGSGLGLFITKNIIESHGGRIWLESKEGEGTTVFFTLPVAEKFEEFLKKL